MTHDERVWELYRGFAAVALNADFIGAFQEKSKQEEYAKRYYATAKTFSTVFEKLSKSEEQKNWRVAQSSRALQDRCEAASESLSL